MKNDDQPSRSVDESVKKLLSGEGKDIPLFKVFMPESVIEPLCKVLLSGYIGEGPRVEEFERQLASWFANSNVLTLNSGTSALQLALRLANVGYGDEVISTPMTCSATNEPILAMGAKIIWADIDPWTGNIDHQDVARKITPKTKAIMCVHWAGYPCDLDELNTIAAEHDIKLIQDACHAFGSTYHGKPIGSQSDFACFSFQAIKEMTTVDGGALVCKSKADCERGRLLRWYGIDRRAKRTDLRCEADIVEFGYKFHMNDMTATIGLEQLKYIGQTIEKYRANASRYNERALRPLKYKDDRSSVYWLYTVRVKNRPEFMEHMKNAGVTVSKVHVRNDTYTMFKDFRTELPGVDEFDSEQISIPVGWWLTEKDLTHIINTTVEYDRRWCSRFREITAPVSKYEKTPTRQPNL
ncbi:MAG: DegT/DnrJ/EryC1/StrS family aminotransferase [Planctomycetota bacterium]|jgi:dTDP-4-amino-4,6-dideoxygalactose transaminase